MAFSKRTLRKLDTIKRKVLEFNKDLQEYYTTTEDNELPDIDITIIGSTSPLDPFTVTDIDDGFIVEADGLEYTVQAVIDENGDEFITGWEYDYDTLKETINYERRRLRKAWKIWYSENPDAEIEKEDEDEE